jgi:hypothetical protein
MTALELNALAMTLAGSTPLSRLNHDEVHVVLAKLTELGFLPAVVADVPAVTK